ncbi:MAG: M14 family metallopeptidase [Akkermansiaceae bacterium]
MSGYSLAVIIDVDKHLETFRQAATAEGFLGESMGEVEGFNMPAYVKKAEGRPRVYMSAGMHGDEPAGVVSLLELMQEGFFCDQVEWRVCPVINPTGLAAGTRENFQGVDVNRDYLNRNTSEARAHIDWLERQPVPGMFISLHEDWESTGFYLYEIQKHACRSHAVEILKAAEGAIITEPSPLIDDHKVREPGWIFHKPRADFPDEWPEAIYMAERGTTVSYTLETPSSLPLSERVACHKLAVARAVEGFLLTHDDVEGCIDGE